MNAVVAIIQARMGSKRLPGKVLAEVHGEPLLWYLLERLKRCKKINKIVVATSTADQDTAIELFCRKTGICCFRGSEDDVLDRYYQCAVLHKVESIVRITADCPLIDPGITDSVIGFYLKNRSFDMVTTGPTYPEGLDTTVFSFASLHVAWSESDLKSEREHVTPFIWKNDKRFKIKTLSMKQSFDFLRLSVDKPVDLEVVRAIVEELYPTKGVDFSLEDILTLYRHKPFIFEKNKYVIRNEGYLKSIKEDGRIKK